MVDPRQGAGRRRHHKARQLPNQGLGHQRSEWQNGGESGAASQAFNHVAPGGGKRLIRRLVARPTQRGVCRPILALKPVGQLGAGLDISDDRKCRNTRPFAVGVLSPKRREALHRALDVAFSQRFRARLYLYIEPPVGKDDFDIFVRLDDDAGGVGARSQQ
jgi:hypothetical protein